LGLAWAVLRPLLAVAVFTLIFGVLAKMPQVGDVPYALVVLSGMVPWFFIAAALIEGSQSLIGDASLVSKTYVPRLLIVLSHVVAGLVDYAVMLVILVIAAMFWAGSQWWFLLPFASVWMLLAALGPAFFFAAMTVQYRDVRFALPFLVQIGMFLTPVLYSSALVPEAWLGLYFANPYAGVVELHRVALLGSAPQEAMLMSLASTAFFLWLGIRAFVRVEQKMADFV
jgi:lipopolysaccharide transport system permease protein